MQEAGMQALRAGRLQLGRVEVGLTVEDQHMPAAWETVHILHSHVEDLTPSYSLDNTSIQRLPSQLVKAFTKQDFTVLNLSSRVINLAY